MKKLNLKGRVFGLLTAHSEAGRSKHGHVQWLCHCACGATTLITVENLRGNTKSCGCLKATQKGASRKPNSLYNTWRAMLRRCYEQSHHAYARYGGRGIIVCEAWHEYLNFEKDMMPRPIGLTLDRINNDGNYEPSNCRWATKAEQAQNRTKNPRLRKDHKVVCFNGEQITVMQLAKRLGIAKEIIYGNIGDDQLINSEFLGKLV